MGLRWPREKHESQLQMGQRETETERHRQTQTEKRQKTEPRRGKHPRYLFLRAIMESLNTLLENQPPLKDQTRKNTFGLMFPGIGFKGDLLFILLATLP